MNKIRYIVIIVSVIIFMIELFLIDFKNFEWSNLLTLLVPTLLIISMGGSIIHVNKHGENR